MNFSRGMPSPPVSSFRCGLKVLSKASMPGSPSLREPLLTSMATTVLPDRRMKSTSRPRSRQ